MNEPAALLTIQLTIGDKITAVDVNMSEAELNAHVDDVMDRIVRPALKQIMPYEKARLQRMLAEAQAMTGIPLNG